jgi:hypothetical protein
MIGELPTPMVVCAENLEAGGMIGPLCFALAVLTSPFLRSVLPEAARVFDLLCLHLAVFFGALFFCNFFGTWNYPQITRDLPAPVRLASEGIVFRKR